MIKSLLKEGVILLANRLKILLAERDLTIKDLMKATGLSRNSLSNMVNNPFANIATDNVDKLCNYLNVTPKNFYDYFPWKFSIGCSLRDRKLKYRFDEKFEVGYFLIAAHSGEEKVKIGFKIYLEASSLEEKNSSITLSIENPNTEQFDELYSDMSPVFRHSLRNEVIRLMQDFCVDLNIEYNLVNLYKDTDKLKFYIKMNGQHLSTYPVQLFSGSFEYKIQDLSSHTIAKKALDQIKKNKK